MNAADEQKLKEYVNASREIVQYLHNKIITETGMPLLDKDRIMAFIKAYEKVNVK